LQPLAAIIVDQEIGPAVSFQLNLNTETVDHCDLDEPLCLAPTDSVTKALMLMKELNRGSVLICHDQFVIGIFTERDALKMMATGASFDAPLQQHMTPDPVLLLARDTVGKAITLMSRGGYRRLPIVDDHGRPTGVIKVEAIMHYLVEHFPKLIYTLPPQPHQSTQLREGA
jgi:predicted transcriptional regulator